MALNNLNIDFELLNYCEIDKFASKSYSLIHNVSEELNLGDISLGYTTLQLEGSYRDPAAKIFNQKNKDYEY